MYVSLLLSKSHKLKWRWAYDIYSLWADRKRNYNQYFLTDSTSQRSWRWKIALSTYVPPKIMYSSFDQQHPLLAAGLLAARMLVVEARTTLGSLTWGAGRREPRKPSKINKKLAKAWNEPLTEFNENVLHIRVFFSTRFEINTTNLSGISSSSCLFNLLKRTIVREIVIGRNQGVARFLLYCLQGQLCFQQWR